MFTQVIYWDLHLRAVLDIPDRYIEPCQILRWLKTVKYFRKKVDLKFFTGLSLWIL